MTDRELLELAAKAAGYPWRNWNVDFHYAMLEQDVSKPEPRIFRPTPWNPLVYNADAFCLAVQLGLSSSSGTQVYTADDDLMAAWADRDSLYGTDLHQQVRWSKSHGDPYAATRRAIVHVAAEIGKAMQQEHRRTTP